LFLIIDLVKTLLGRDKVRKEAVRDFLAGNFGGKDISLIK